MELARTGEPTGRETPIAGHVEDSSGVQVKKFGYLSSIEDWRVLLSDGLESVPPFAPLAVGPRWTRRVRW